MLLRYLAETHQRVHREKIGELVEMAAGPEAQEVIVTWLDEIKLEGHKEGHKEGRKEGRAEALLEQLRARFGAVPADVRSRVQAAGAADLARWGLRVLTAASLAEVFVAARSKAAPARKASARKAAPRKPAASKSTARKSARRS